MANSKEKFRAVYYGRVLPERAWVDFREPIIYEFKFHEHEQPCSIEIQIRLNQVTAVVESSEKISDRATLKNCVEDFVRGVVDFFGYVHGHGYDVDIVAACYEQTAENQVFGITGFLFSDEEREQRQEKLMPLFRHVSSPYLRSALADLREAIRMPMETAFFSKRAIDSVMQAFKEDSGTNSEKKAWEKMGSALNLRQEWLIDLKSLAGDRRHGNPIDISWKKRLEAMKLVWLVIDRYLEYLNRGKEPLPESEFPIP